MIQTLKDVAESTKAFLIWVVAPFVFMAGYTYYLLTQNKKLLNQVSEEKNNVKLAEVKTEQAQADADASDVVSRYKSLYAKYKQLGTDDEPKP